MSHIDDPNFNEALQLFMKRYPPAKSISDSELKFTTGEVLNMIISFFPVVEVSEDEKSPTLFQQVYDLLKESGYKYEPVEYNEKVTFYWLFRKAKEGESF